MKGWHFQKLLLHVNVLLNAVYYGDVFYKPYGLFSHLSSTEAIKCVLGGWAFRESRSVGAALTVKTWGVCVCVCVYRFGCRPADRHPSTHQTPVSQTPDGGKELQHQGQVWTRTRTRISPAARTGSDSAADVLLSVSSGFWMKFCRKWFIWCRRKSVWVGLCNTVTHTRTHTHGFSCGVEHSRTPTHPPHTHHRWISSPRPPCALQPNLPPSTLSRWKPKLGLTLIGPRAAAGLRQLWMWPRSWLTTLELFKEFWSMKFGQFFGKVSNDFLAVPIIFFIASLPVHLCRDWLITQYN